MNFNEFITLEEKADKESEIRKKFGRVLFGDFQYSRELTKEREKDTKYENKIFKYVSDWFYDTGNNLNSIKAMRELSKLKDDYPTILEPDPISKYPALYRALLVRRTNKELNKIHKTLFAQRKNYQIIGEKGNHIIYKLGDNNHQYKPKREIESWTTTFNNAFKFIKKVDSNYGMDYSNAGQPIIIYAAKVPQEERLFKLKFTNKMFDYPESEVIRISNKPILSTMYYIIRKGALGDYGEDVYEV